MHATVHNEDSEAWWRKHHDMGMFHILRVGPIYRIPGIMDQFEYITILEYIIMLPNAEEEMPWKWMFNKTTTPNTQVSEQHLGSRQTRLTLWSGQPNLQTLIQ